MFGAIGIGKTHDDEGSLGSGLNAGGGFGYRLSRRFAVEAEVNAFRTQRDFSSSFAPLQANGAHVMGSGVLYLNRGTGADVPAAGCGLAACTREERIRRSARQQVRERLRCQFRRRAQDLR